MSEISVVCLNMASPLTSNMQKTFVGVLKKVLQHAENIATK